MTLHPENATHRPVRPIDLEGALASALFPKLDGSIAREPLDPGQGEIEERLSDLMWVIADVTLIAERMRTLAYLLDLAVEDDRPKQLGMAGHLVTSCVRTMADQLDGVEQRARAHQEAIVAEVAP